MPPLSSDAIVLGLDLGATSAWCLGRRGQKPDSGVLKLPFDVDEPSGFSFFYKSLAEITEGRRPRIVAVEQRLVSQFKSGANTNAAALKRLYGLHAIACMFAANCAARLQETHVASIRKAVLPTLPRAERGKPQVKAWATRQGFGDPKMPTDQSDAIALWAHTVNWFGDGI